MVRSSRAKGEGDSLSLAFILVFFILPLHTIEDICVFGLYLCWEEIMEKCGVLRTF
jgi:hypothetical protein